MRHVLHVLSVLTVCMAAPAWAQPKSVPQLPALQGDYFPLASRATNRTYQIHVRLPEGYNRSQAARYPVVYVLDGDSLFPILAASHLFLTIDDKLPEAIIVGIAYGSFDPAINKRSIDMMPPSPNVAPDASGAPLFQRFLKSELIPAIEARYRADPARRTLFGQSRGGSFVLYCALTDPDLFWGGIANNPALPPTREFFYAKAAPASRKDLTLIVVNGTEDRAEFRVETQAWLADREKRKDDPWTLKNVGVDHGSHSANNVDAYRAAMRLLFNWRSGAAR